LRHKRPRLVIDFRSFRNNRPTRALNRGHLSRTGAGLLLQSSASVSLPLVERKLTDLFASRPQVISTTLLLLLLELIKHRYVHSMIRQLKPS